MFTLLTKQLRIPLFFLIIMTVLTGVLYPLLMTIIGQVCFPFQTNGSLIKTGDHQLIGSQLIGQHFTLSRYFWGRPSMTTPTPYNAANSVNSSYGPSNVALFTTIEKRIKTLSKTTAAPAVDKKNHLSLNKGIPADLVMASASGLDPEISPLAAYYQIPRVAKARGISEKTLRELVTKHIEARSLSILGEPRVNVLELNLDLDKHTGWNGQPLKNF